MFIQYINIGTQMHCNLDTVQWRFNVMLLHWQFTCTKDRLRSSVTTVNGIAEESYSKTDWTSIRATSSSADSKWSCYFTISHEIHNGACLLFKTNKYIMVLHCVFVGKIAGWRILSCAKYERRSISTKAHFETHRSKQQVAVLSQQ